MNDTARERDAAPAHVLHPVSNPPNPWLSTEVEWIGPPPAQPLRVYAEDARSILSENHSPDLGFRYSLNPYRGCQHACAYCYARPTHEYLDLGAGSDFDRVIIVKQNAPELLERALRAPRWRGEMVVFSGVTDCYQPLEASYRLTRGCLEVCHAYRNPVGVITKSALVRRDAALLAKLARDARCMVYVSIPFLDPDLARAIEPGAPSPAARLATVRALAEAGVPTGVAVAPIIPGLSDDQVASILEAAHAAGARRAFRILLRLPGSVRPVFEQRIATLHPARARRVMASLTEMRGDTGLAGAGFGARFVGQGPRWRILDRLFEVTCRRLGLAVHEESDAHGADQPTTFRRPVQQGELFG